MYFYFWIKKQNYSTSETSENVYLSAFISSFVVCIYVQYFFDVVRNQTQRISVRVNQKKITGSWIEYVRWTCFGFWPIISIFQKLSEPIRIMDYGLVTIYTLSQYPGWIHPGTFPGENDAYKISPPWKRFEFSTSPVCIGNLSLPERNCELLMFPSEFLKFWYFAGDIAQKVFGSWLTSVSFKIYSGYK